MTRREAKDRLKELSMAGDRLGVTDYQVTEWLLRFAQTDLSQLSHDEWQNLEHEIHALTVFQGHHFKTDPPIVAGSRLNWDKTLSIGEIPDIQRLSAVGIRRLHSIVQDRLGLLFSKLPTNKQISELQSELRDIIGQLLDKKGVIFCTPAISRIVNPWPATKTLPEHIQMTILVESPEDLFRVAVQENLIPVSPRILRCPECLRAFLRGRKDQGFCSKSCQVRMAVRRYRSTPPDRVGKRGRPVGSISKKKGGRIEKKQTKRKGTT